MIIAFGDFFSDKSVLREPQRYRGGAVTTSLNRRGGWLLRGTTRRTYRMSLGPRMFTYLPYVCVCMCVYAHLLTGGQVGP